MPCVDIEVVSAGKLKVVDIRAEKNTYAIGEDAKVYVTVKNEGGTSASGRLSITIDGTEKLGETITIGAGEAKTYEITIPSMYINVPKQYTICAEVHQL